MRPANEKIQSIIPQLRKYLAERTGGAEVIRTLRDTLHSKGLKPKKKNIPYRHQKLLEERARTEFNQRREELRQQGIFLKRKIDKKKAMAKKRKL
ncbi:hypothetical protein NEOKW01_0322 [Nematocida sp. AWRm80]|nr:hypothetical protein NEOKW01_0322 [Nematocida sp. AWRm80]